MLAGGQEQTIAVRWAQGIGLAAQASADARAAELTRVERALREALVEDDRAEIIGQFDRAVVLFAQLRRWHDGLTAAREVYAAVGRWVESDAVPYALTLAQFAHNYAIELFQARLFEAAEEHYGEALSLFKAAGDGKRALVSAHELGRSQQAQGKYASAEESYRLSLELATERSDDPHIARNLFQLGQVAQLTGHADRSASLYGEVLALTQTISAWPLWTAAAHQLGILAQERREYAEARNWFERALDRARESDDAQGMTNALHQLGMVAHEQGDLPRAQELYLASLSSAPVIVDAAPTLYQLAQAAGARGDWASAERYGRQALSVFQAQGDAGSIQRVQTLLRLLESRRASVAVC